MTRVAKSWVKIRLRNLLLAAGVLTAFTAAAMACGWYFSSDESVRFNSERYGRGFYRLPPLPISYDAEKDREIANGESTWNEWSTEPSGSSSDQPSKSSLVWEQATELIGKGEMRAARVGLEEYLSLTASRSIDEDGDRQERRNSAYDLVDAMKELDRGAKLESVKDYVASRIAHDESRPEQTAESARSDPRLADNWAYLHAAGLYKDKKTEEALAAFVDHVRSFPKSEKNEAAKFMAARILMGQSYAFEHAGCGDYPVDNFGEAFDLQQPESAERCRDEMWTRSVKALRDLQRDFPNGRYRTDVRGWLAFMLAQGGERAEALSEYYRMLGDPADRNARLEAKKSLQLIGHSYSDDVLDRTEALIESDANAALAYAYHRIYNYAIDLTYREVESWYGSDSESKRSRETEVANATSRGKHELERTVRFASAMMKRYPATRISGGFVLRIAQANLELQNWKQAEFNGKKALALGIDGEVRAQATWIVGSAQHASGNLKGARLTFTKLVIEFPKSKLTRGARRLLAITAEDEGDLEGALEQYLLLEYREDIAYFLDVLMPTDRLAKFIDDHQVLPQREMLLYSLGLRYMREKRWSEARQTLNRVRTEYRPVESNDIYGRSRRYSKEPSYDDDSAIRSGWVMQDLQTIDILEQLEKKVAAAQGDEAKAEAMYQYASYFYDADTLLFYNPSLWGGVRIYHLYDLSVGKNGRQPNESQIMFDYSKHHDTLALAILVYQEIVEKYPHTKAGSDALYSLLVAQEKLGDMNYYWREIYGNGFFVGTREYAWADIRRMYPKFRWPKSKEGWEASTRTVSGGPAYEPLPKKKPPLSFGERVSRKLSRWYGEYSPRPVAAMWWLIGELGFYLKAHLAMWFAAFSGLIVWGNRSAIHAAATSSPVLSFMDYLQAAYRWILFKIKNALPRLSIMYLVKRTYERIKNALC